MAESDQQAKADVQALAREIYIHKQLSPTRAYDLAREFLKYKDNKDLDGLEAVDIDIKYAIIADHTQFAFGLRLGEYVIDAWCSEFSDIHKKRFIIGDSEEVGSRPIDYFRTKIEPQLAGNGQKIGKITMVNARGKR